ncbi:hypothetical protein BDZ89DRAFT_1160608 [Hymenopellis radicata]|nr:hypothetical protein BDZ89DRAFT_1160608 [Hymenopellis radicata]
MREKMPPPGKDASFCGSHLTLTRTMTTRTREARFMDLKPPHYGRDDVASPRPKYPPGNFLDTHIDENLVLRRVVLHPPLLTALAHVVDAKLGGFYNHHLIPDDFFGRPQDWYRSPVDVNTAEPIAMTHQMGAGSVGSQLASSIYVHPEQPQIFSALFWGQSELDTCDHNSSNSFLVEHVFLRFANYRVREPRFLQKFHPEMRPKMLDIGKQYPHCATAMFFCPAAHELLRKMERVAEMKEFPWTSNSTTVNPSPAPKVPQPPDNPHPLWTLPKLDPVPRRDGHIRRSSRTDSPVVDYCSPGCVMSIGMENWHDNPAQYIQRLTPLSLCSTAGTTYVSEFVIARRIETLILSDLLDVCHAKNPAYGKIWAGMHIAIAQDVMERYQIRLASQPVSVPTAGLKRAAPDTEESPNKKRKATARGELGSKGFYAKIGTSKRQGETTTSRRKSSGGRITQSVDHDKVVGLSSGTVTQMNNLETSFSRHVAIAIYIRFGIYNSPSPSILLQPEQRRSAAYPPASYLTLVLNSRLGTGATGDVFGATISNVKHGPIVVKLATTFRRLCRLRHEYSVYAHLKNANVKCIPRVFGFYQDVQRSAGALILSNDGRSLGGRRAKLTADEKTLIRAAMSSIHAAGVLHRDLRTWNILVDDAGTGISIIDFDRSNIDAQEKDFPVEWERLEKLLKGKHVENGQVIGKDGMPANIGDLVNDNPDV